MTSERADRRPPRSPALRPPAGPDRPIGASGPMVARSPDDLLAAVPVVLGFHPRDSLVMLTTGGSSPRPLHARVDLPPGGGPTGRATDRDVAGSVLPLRDAALLNRVDQVAFVLYTGDPRLGRQVTAALEAEFADVGVLGVLRVHDGWWRAVDSDGEGPPRAHDVGTHPFAAQAVVEGAVIHRDRAALADTVARDPAASAAVAALVDAAEPGSGPAGGGRPADVGWAVALTDAATADHPATDAEVARLVRLLRDVEVRDEVWLRLTRARAPDLVPWWSDVVRRTPDRLVPDAACLLAFTAWLAGHGALAWCAVDRCRAADPTHTGGDLVAALLDRAVPPTDWEELGPH